MWVRRMHELGPTPKLGQLIRVRNGRDRGQISVIVELIDNRFVAIADGEKRKINRTKRKNIIHIELFDYIAEEVHISLIETGRVTNGKLRSAISTFLDEHIDLLEEGELIHGERRSN